MASHPRPEVEVAGASAGEASPPPRPKYEREVANFVALTRDLAARRLVWESRPSYVEYSTNSACNLRCPMCGQSDSPPVVSTPLKLQGPFLDEVLRDATFLYPSALSEPLLNNMDRLLPVLERHGVFLDLITNGVLLTPEMLERLLPRLYRLILSFDSHRKEVYEKIRTPARYETVVAHARNAARVCGGAGVPMIFQMVLVADVVEDLEGYVDFVADLGARRISVLELLPGSTRFAELDPFPRVGRDGMARRLEAMRARAERRGVGLLVEVSPPLGGQYDYATPPMRLHSAAVLDLLHAELAVSHLGFCPMVMTYLKVEPDGKAFPCCRAPADLLLGNAIEEGVEAVWNGARMQELRRRMLAGDPPACCRGCLVPEVPRWRAASRLPPDPPAP